MKRSILSLLSVTVLCAGSVFAGEVPAWPGIKVEVRADQPVATAQNLREQADGFQRLEITLSNKGQQPLTIDKITVRIPLAERLATDLQMLYGGSCMGRTPLLRQTVGGQTQQSSSHMYEMVRLADEKYLFAGSLSWRIFLPNFTLAKDAFVVWSDGEGRQLQPGETIQYEQIVLTRASNWLDLLDRFGSAIALENHIGKLKPVEFTGWSTWDYYGRLFTADDVYGNITELKKIAPEANLIQIDSGWWTERGDYTSVRSNLPGGIKAMADRIRAEGKIPGLHFDGFRGDANSEICKAHPEYFLHDQNGKLIVEVKRKPDETMHYTYFDYSHPGARAHIAECVRTMKEWGIRYFKVDFMRYGLEADIKKNNPSVKRIKAHDPRITGVERFRLGLRTIREAIGPENYFLGCSAVFGPCIGFVDGMRTGGDISPRYEAFSQRCLANAGNYYLKKVFNTDSDYLVFREAADEDVKVSRDGKKSGGNLALNEAKMWADFNSVCGNCRLTSDNLMSLRSERKALVQKVLTWPAMDETVPLDIWRHATEKSDGFELLLARKGKDVYLGIFNWGDAPKDYALPAFGKRDPVPLQGRHSVILKYEGNEPFDQLCKKFQSQ